MKKTLLFLFTFMLALVNVFAQETTLTWTTGDWNGLTLTKDGYTITLDKAQASNDPVVRTDGEIRLYAKSTVTVSSANQDIKKINFVLTNQGKQRLPELTAAPAGTMTYSHEKGNATWEGTGKSVTFTLGDKAVNGSTPTKAGQLCFNSIVISAEGGTVTPNPQPQPQPAQKGEVFSAPFSTDLSGFTTQNVTLPAGFTEIWQLDTRYGCVKASAFANKKASAAESWLISPIIDLTKTTANELAFDNVGNFFKTDGIAKACSVKIKEVNGQWTTLTLNGLPEKDAWNPWVTTTADLKAYDGKKVQIALVYTSTDQIAGTWEIKNFKVLGEGASVPVEVAVPTFTTTTTAFRGTLKVEMAAAEGLQIHYTTDGTIATAESTLYAGGIDVSKTTTINAVAVDAEGNVSKNVKQIYNLVEAPVAPEGAVVYDFFLNEWNLPVSNNETSVAIEKIEKDGFLITLMPPTNNPKASYTVENRLWYDSKNGIQLRVYQGAILKFQAPQGKKIQKVTFNAPKFFINCSVGTFNENVWNGPSDSEIVDFTVTKTSNINSIVIEYVSEATGIDGVEADQKVEKVVYSIDGRRLQAPVKGLNIINGQKVLVK